jgi:hypothetical protein
MRWLGGIARASKERSSLVCGSSGRDLPEEGCGDWYLRGIAQAKPRRKRLFPPRALLPSRKDAEPRISGEEIFRITAAPNLNLSLTPTVVHVRETRSSGFPNAARPLRWVALKLRKELLQGDDNASQSSCVPLLASECPLIPSSPKASAPV